MTDSRGQGIAFVDVPDSPGSHNPNTQQPLGGATDTQWFDADGRVACQAATGTRPICDSGGVLSYKPSAAAADTGALVLFYDPSNRYDSLMSAWSLGANDVAPQLGLGLYDLTPVEQVGRNVHVAPLFGGLDRIGALIRYYDGPCSFVQALPVDQIKPPPLKKVTFPFQLFGFPGAGGLYVNVTVATPKLSTFAATSFLRGPGVDEINTNVTGGVLASASGTADVNLDIPVLPPLVSVEVPDYDWSVRAAVPVKLSGGLVGLDTASDDLRIDVKEDFSSPGVGGCGVRVQFDCLLKVFGVCILPGLDVAVTICPSDTIKSRISDQVTAGISDPANDPSQCQIVPLPDLTNLSALSVKTCNSAADCTTASGAVMPLLDSLSAAGGTQLGASAATLATVHAQATDAANYRCAPLPAQCAADFQNLPYSVPANTNVCQYVPRAEKLNVRPDAVELVWFSGTPAAPGTVTSGYTLFAALSALGQPSLTQSMCTPQRNGSSYTASVQEANHPPTLDFVAPAPADPASPAAGAPAFDLIGELPYGIPYNDYIRTFSGDQDDGSLALGLTWSLALPDNQLGANTPFYPWAFQGVDLSRPESLANIGPATFTAMGADSQGLAVVRYVEVEGTDLAPDIALSEPVVQSDGFIHAQVGVPVTFASATTDPNEPGVTQCGLWQQGDGPFQPEPPFGTEVCVFTFTFDQTGETSVTFAVFGGSKTFPVMVDPAPPPAQTLTVRITSPVNGQQVQGGETVSLDGFASGPNGINFFDWSVDGLDVNGGGCSGPNGGPCQIDLQSSSYAAVSQSCPSQDTIVLTVRDSTGASATDSVTVNVQGTGGGFCP
ncbi:MAG TPA: hypothetical protein VHE30_01965 [Polyangiaceae bacterium]|nr:hypothetical protein [Polyangiaceae bacterium]